MKFIYLIPLCCLVLLTGCFNDDRIVLDAKEPQITNTIRFRRLADLPNTFGVETHCDRPARQFHNVRRLAGGNRYLNRVGWLPEDFPVAEVGILFLGNDGDVLGDLNNVNLIRNFQNGTTDAVPHPWIRVVRNGKVYRSILFDEGSFSVTKSDANAEFIPLFYTNTGRLCERSDVPLVTTSLNYTGYLYDIEEATDSILLEALSVHFNNTAF